VKFPGEGSNDVENENVREMVSWNDHDDDLSTMSPLV